MSTGRNIIGVVGGVVLAAASIALAEAAGHSILKGQALFGGAVLGYGLGALIGTFTTAMIAGQRVSATIPSILAILTAINLFSFPHPIWFAPAAFVAISLGWFIGSRLASYDQNKPPSPEIPDD